VRVEILVERVVKSVEVAIVGGGPAGIATALFLTHAAPELTDRIVVLEKERYPREKYCAGAVGARGDKLLGSIGVRVDVPSVPLSGVAFRAMGRTHVVRDGAPGSVGRVIRRIEFDHELAKTAMRRGIRVLDGARVRDVSFGDSGVELDSAVGRFRARVLVAADGVQSVVRRTLGLSSTRYRAQALEIDTEPVASDLERDVMLFDASHRELPGYYWDFPTVVGGREMVCRGVYLLKTGDTDPPVEIQRVLEDELRARGLDLGRYKKKRYAERGFEIHAPISVPRVLLVGEAAGIDPVTGEGIAQALQYGAVAGRYVARKLAERNLEFADWRREVGATMIGRDLIVRTMGVGMFYGPGRARVESFLLDTPEFVRVGLQHFAGKRWSRVDMLSSAWAGMRHAARWALRIAPRFEPSAEAGERALRAA
jgi:menaquinone-9 beta-reductase